VTAWQLRRNSVTPSRLEREAVEVIRPLALAACVAAFTAGCAGGGVASSMPPIASIGPASSASPEAVPIAIATQASVPEGRVLFLRWGQDRLEQYFTVNTDGTNEKALFTREGCAPCVRWSADGTQIWTIDATGHGTWSFTTLEPDGSDRKVISPRIETLNLSPGASTSDGSRIAFSGWDETNPSRDGLYIGSTTLADLDFVTPYPKGTVSAEPFGVTPDGSHVLFFADRGKTEHLDGDLYVVGADGSGLRQLNPSGTTHNFINVPAGSLSPDGRRAAFGVEGRVYVVDVDGGIAQPITEPADFVWAVSWSPTADWITYTRQYGSTSVITLVRPDGSDQHEISANDASDEVEDGVWSPDGKYLLVQRGTDGRGDLWIIDLEGNYVGQVTHGPSNYSTYSWAPGD
jgi:Tol biopolymer transport system component